MKVGYARVSSVGQNLQSQLDALKEHKVERIFLKKFQELQQKAESN